tara:strand:+ start:585 stop:1628 length:1044 start_codon:yes stop_codon:yes gene_type:complete
MTFSKITRSISLCVAWSVIGLILLIATLLGAMFLFFSLQPSEWLSITAACLLPILILVAMIFIRPPWQGVVAAILLLAVPFTWFFLLTPSNQRDWQDPVARVPVVDFDGDIVTIRDQRAFRYRTVDDFDIDWVERSYDLDQLTGIDVMFVYWGSPDIAHTMLSFAFSTGPRLVVSVETRMESGEQYGALRSFFKQYELIYILADERDVVALRTNHRGEDVYIFPLSIEPIERRELLVEILTRANELGQKPDFYRTIGANCTTTLLKDLGQVRGDHSPWRIEVLLNGRMPRMAYDRGQLPTDAPYEEVISRYRVNDRAVEGGTGPGFSERIRAGLGPALRPVPSSVVD